MGWVIDYFETELRRLEKVDHHRTRGANVLECRRQMATTLAQRYNELGEQNMSQYWEDYVQQISAAATALAQGKREPLIEQIRSNKLENN